MIPETPKLRKTSHDYLQVLESVRQLVEHAEPYSANAVIQSIFSAIFIRRGAIVRYELQPDVREWLRLKDNAGGD